MKQHRSKSHSRLRGFTLIELLVVIAIIALLIGVMLPGLAGARNAAQQARCLSKQRQLGTAWMMYAADHSGYAMPARTSEGDTSRSDRVYWWGAENLQEARIDHTRGLIAAGLGNAATGEDSVFECPSQPFGSYTPQGQIQTSDGGTATSTYGYNAYGLCPPSAGYDAIRDQPWLRLDQIKRPDTLAVFADAMIEFGPVLKNSVLLDPPKLFDSRGRWRTNRSPTTSFRHGERAVVVMADGSVSARSTGVELTGNAVGSLSEEVSPFYVQNARGWVVKRD